MKERNLRGVIAVALGVCLSVGLFATNAIAKPAPVTKISFKLDDHNVPPGSPVTSDVLVRTRSNHEWVPFANALLSVRVDGTQVLTVTTDANGKAAISYVAAAGGHVMKVVFAGDATHKRAQRAQGFAVVAGATTVPSAPTLTATAGLAMVHLSWTAPADGGSTITTYNIYRSTISGSEALFTSIPAGTVFDDFAVLSGTTYFYEVSAYERRRRGRDVVRRYQRLRCEARIIQELVTASDHSTEQGGGKACGRSIASWRSQRRPRCSRRSPSRRRPPRRGPTAGSVSTRSNPGYVTSYLIATSDGSFEGEDATIQECSRSRGRQNEPAVGVDPRNTDVILGSSNDYCGVYNDGEDAEGAPLPVGPIWLGYYRSEDGGGSFTSSLVPGYPGDPTPYAGRAHIRTASSGDPVIAWDNFGNAYFGSESSDDPAGTLKTFGDEWVGRYMNPRGPSDPGYTTLDDGKEFAYSNVVAKGSSAPNLLGKFNDKTAIEADRTGACPGLNGTGNVYFAYSRFTGNHGGSSIYFSRSTDQGRTWTQPWAPVAEGAQRSVRRHRDHGQRPRVRGVGLRRHRCLRPVDRLRGDVHEAEDRRELHPKLALRQLGAPGRARHQPCRPGRRRRGGRDRAGDARDCGSLYDHCASGYTFIRRDTQVRRAPTSRGRTSPSTSSSTPASPTPLPRRRGRIRPYPATAWPR